MEIKPAYEHSTLGNWCFNICADFAKFLLKHRWLYYLLAVTWGFILTFAGILVTLVLMAASVFCNNIHFFSYYWIYGVKVGPVYWGGFEMGLMFCRDHKSSDMAINPHEFAHTLQACLFGPFTPIIITIPSAIRYWYQVIRENKGLENKPYAQIWFEDSADQIGAYAVKYLMDKKYN